MTWRKLKADRLFDGETLHEDKVLIVSAEGRIENIIPAGEAADAEALKGTLMPGMVNAHLHLELSHMLGRIPEKTGLSGFVEAVMRQRLTDTDEQQEAMRRADRQMFEAGIVAAGDICNTADSLEVKKQSGIRYYSFVEATGWDPAQAATRMTRLVQTYEFFKETGPASIVPHAPYSVSNVLWEAIEPYYWEQVVTMHNQETEAENELFLKNEGSFRAFYERMGIAHHHFAHPATTSIRAVLDHLLSACSIILVHNTFMGADDMEYLLQQLVQQRLHLCICANANLYIEDRLPPVMEFVKEGLEICLGTDSLASNHQLSIAEEMRTLQAHFPGLSLHQLLRWATSNGARALNMEDRFGYLRKGYTPGVVLLGDDFSAERIC